MSTQSPFRLVIVGAGMITASNHLPVALGCSAVKVTGIVDTQVERARSLVQAYGLDAVACSTLQEALSNADGVIIATPNHTHKALAIECIETGLPVLIEKPLATTVEDGEAVVNCAKHHGVTVAVGYQARYRDNLQLLKDLLASRRFGRVRRFARQAGTRGGWAPLSGYNLDRRASGGGVLVVSGTHFLDTMLGLWGYPERVEFWDDSLGGIEAHCQARFAFREADGNVFDGLVISSKLVSLPAGLVIETDRGYLVIPDDDDADILFKPCEASLEYCVLKRREPGRFPRKMSVAERLLVDFVDAARTRRAPLANADEALLSLRLLRDLYAAREAMNEHWYPARKLPRLA
jgi:predicted dehydrogenase